MYQFFVEPSCISTDTVCIRGNDVNHIRNVLRMKPGEELLVSNGMDGKGYRCRIREFDEEAVVCDLCGIEEEGTELSSRIYLFQGLPKGDKMELIIQKAVELGVYEIVPVACKRCVVKLDAKKAENKIARWQGIAQAAAKQSKRGIIPSIHPVMSFREAIDYASQKEIKLIPYELAEGMGQTAERLESIRSGQDVAVFIGPEGGFEPREIEEAQESGVTPITLGKRILRTETAGITILSILMYLLERKSYSNSRIDE